MAIGGKAGLVLWLVTAATVVGFGVVAWGRFGRAIRRVFELNSSLSYASRDVFLQSRLGVVESAGAPHRFVFRSASIAPFELRVFHEDDALVLDASDAVGAIGARAAAEEMEAFREPGADLDRFQLRYPPPRDLVRVAAGAMDLFERVLGGAPDVEMEVSGLRYDEITFSELVAAAGGGK